MSRDGQQFINYWDSTVRAVTITIAMEAGKGSYELPDKQLLQNNARWIGIVCRDPGSDRKTRTGADLVNELAFKASHISLKDTVSDEYLREVPLELLTPKTGDNWFFRLPDKPFDIANSKISLSDPTLAVDGEEYELTIFYR